MLQMSRAQYYVETSRKKNEKPYSRLNSVSRAKYQKISYPIIFYFVVKWKSFL